jgi:HEAT repeat protein
MPILPSRAKEIQELVERLASPSAAHRDSAVARLTLLGTRGVDALLASLPTAGRTARLAALEVLERLAPPQAAPEVLALCQEKDVEIAVRALKVATAYPQPRTLDVLTRILEGGAPEARRAAAESLARLNVSGLVSAIDPLLDVLLDDGEDDALRVLVFDALGTLSSRTLLPLVERLRTSPSPALCARVLQWEAARAGSAPPAAVPERLVRRLGDLGELPLAEERALFAELATVGLPALELVLEELLGPDTVPAVVLRLGRALRHFGPEAAEPIGDALDRATDLAAIRVLADALAHYGAPASIPPLLRALQRLDASTRGGRTGANAVADVKARIHLALAALDSRVALYDLREMLLEPPSGATPVLLDAAARIGDKTLVPALARLAAREGRTRTECASALGAIVRREKLRRSSPAVKGLRPPDRAALEAIWPKSERRGETRAR